MKNFHFALRSLKANVKHIISQSKVMCSASRACSQKVILFLLSGQGGGQPDYTQAWAEYYRQQGYYYPYQQQPGQPQQPGIPGQQPPQGPPTGPPGAPQGGPPGPQQGQQ